MNTIILDARQIKPLQPAFGLWEKYRPEAAPLRFQAHDADGGRAWQAITRQALAETLGLAAFPPVPLEPKVLERVDRGDFIREKILLATTANVQMTAYLLLPKGTTGPRPTVVAFHGHGYGVKDIVGLWEDGSERLTPDGYQKDFAVALCRRGFVVAAPEISGFGERQSDFSHLDTVLGQSAASTCTHSAMLAFHLGLSVVGMRVADGLRLVDYLQTRSECDLQRLGAMGISGGGMHTFFSTALDPRIKACVISGYFCPFRDSILAMFHCACNFVPGLHRFGEIYDLVGLIAPRPLLVEAATRDPIFPIEPAKRAVEQARQVYAVFGAPAALATDYFEGRHQIGGGRAYDFLAEALGARS